MKEFKIWVDAQAEKINDGQDNGDPTYGEAELTEKQANAGLMFALLLRSPKNIPPKERLRKMVEVFDNPQNFQILDDVRCQRKPVKSLDKIIWG